MKILVLCPHFAPDVAPTGEVMTAIVNQWADMGHTVHVITALPWYRRHAVEPEWEGRLVQTEAMPWGAVSRLYPFPTDKSNIRARALAFGGFTGLMLARSLAIRVRPDVVMTMSPPLPLGVPGWLTASTRRVPHVLNVQDVFPDVAIDVGVMTNPRVIEAARFLERFLYRRSAAVTVLSEDLRANLAEKLRGSQPERVKVIPNFVDTKRVVPTDRMNAYRDEFGLGDATVVMYAGNVGLSQPLDIVVEAARHFRDRADVKFVINGSGSTLPDVRAAAADLDNVVFVPMQPRERLAEVLAAGDIHLIPLRRGVARSSVPSKMYSILAAARPVIASVDAGTEVANTLDTAGAGVSVEPESAPALIAALGSLLDEPARRAEMGRKGRQWVENWLSPQAVAGAYIDLFDDLVGSDRPATKVRANGRSPASLS